jgi:hypothetical protein
MPPRALPYSRFIELLIMLECYIPAFPQTLGGEFLIFRWGQGYNPKPSGPAVAFIHRDKEELVTQLEIQKALRVLDIPERTFWQHADNCMVKPDREKSSHLPADSPDPSKSSC